MSKRMGSNFPTPSRLREAFNDYNRKVPKQKQEKKRRQRSAGDLLALAERDARAFQKRVAAGNCGVKKCRCCAETGKSVVDTGQSVIPVILIPAAAPKQIP